MFLRSYPSTSLKDDHILMLENKRYGGWVKFLHALSLKCRPSNICLTDCVRVLWSQVNGLLTICTGSAVSWKLECVQWLRSAVVDCSDKDFFQSYCGKESSVTFGKIFGFPQAMESPVWTAAQKGRKFLEWQWYLNFPTQFSRVCEAKDWDHSQKRCGFGVFQKQCLFLNQHHCSNMK